jgi:hypothetical protein
VLHVIFPKSLTSGQLHYSDVMILFDLYIIFELETNFASNMTRQITLTSLNRKGNTTDMKIYNSWFMLIFFLNLNIYQTKIILFFIKANTYVLTLFFNQDVTIFDNYK